MQSNGSVSRSLSDQIPSSTSDNGLGIGDAFAHQVETMAPSARGHVIAQGIKSSNKKTTGDTGFGAQIQNRSQTNDDDAMTSKASDTSTIPDQSIKETNSFDTDDCLTKIEDMISDFTMEWNKNPSPVRTWMLQNKDIRDTSPIKILKCVINILRSKYAKVRLIRNGIVFNDHDLCHLGVQAMISDLGCGWLRLLVSWGAT